MGSLTRLVILVLLHSVLFQLLGGFYAKVREGVDRPGIVAALAAFGGSLDVLYSIYRHLPRPVMLDFFLPHYSAARIAFLSMFNQTILD